MSIFLSNSFSRPSVSAIIHQIHAIILWMRIPRIKIHLSPMMRYFLASLIFLGIAAFVLTWFLEYRFYVNDVSKAWYFVFVNQKPFLYNVLFMWIMLVFLWAIFEKPGTTVGTMWIILIILSYIHIEKYKARGFPLLPEDFRLASEASALTSFVDFGSIIRLVIAILLVIALIVLFNRKVARKIGLEYRNPSPSFGKRHYLATRLIILIISSLGFYTLTDTVCHYDGTRWAENILGTHFTAWNQNDNYHDNGFIVGFLYNLMRLRLPEPDKYSEAKIADLKNEYDDRAENENLNRIAANEEDVSIVLILNESFYDPAVNYMNISFEEYYPHTGGDVTPNLHKLMHDYPSGYMYSLDYGGGTANIEFEAVTSLTNYWINTVPYTALIPRAGDIPSIAQTYKKLGYETVAIHPYNGSMYKRNISLKNEGFDKFITELEMDYKETEGSSKYINDRSSYRQTLDVLKGSDKNQVIHLITMQNHMPYEAGIYDETNFTLLNDDISDKKKSEISVYYQYIYNSDKYLGEFIDELEKLDKKVVVLFYGDHAPGLFDKFYYDGDETEKLVSYVTPYFVYANYDATFINKHLPTTTPNCMVNTMHNTLNWKKDSLHYLLDEVCDAQPILTASYIKGSELNAPELLHDYELLTYDLLNGKKYWMSK